MSCPLISVIIPAHNSATTIGTAIASMAEQTYPNLEIIVIDDNSTDETKAVVRELMKKYANLFYYALPYDDPHRFNRRGRNINAGYAARNYGFEKVRGQWITFQDADDASLLNRIEVQYELAQKYSSNHVCIDWRTYDDALVGKKLDIDAIMSESEKVMISKQEIQKLIRKTKGPIVPFLGPINALIPFEFKRLRIINKLFFGSLDPYPYAGNSPLFKREITEKVKFRALKDRIWPSFMGRGADRDFNFQVAETFQNSCAFRIPLYLWRVKNQNERYMATKFTIVTPVYNGETYLAETMESVLAQEGDFEIEYIIRDGGSTDGTLSILTSYDEKLRNGIYPVKCKGITLAWHSEKDAGMYDAITKGFARATGDICAYLNADDLYLPGAFAAVANIFIAHPEIEWLKGITAFCNEKSAIVSSAPGYLYRQAWLQKGIYGRSAYFVHQDSVFWRRSLWEKARPVLSSFLLAGDYALWITFAKYAPLWSCNTRVSVFRKRSGQLSADMVPYRREQEQIAPHHFFLEKRVLLFFSMIRFFTIRPESNIARALFFILFPLNKQQWYLDMSIAGQPIKKRAASYLMEDHDPSPPMAQK